LLDEEDDPVDRLWKVTVEDGQRVETLDPNDPNVKRILQAEASKASVALQESTLRVPDSAPEKLLLLLTLLRERIKTEAAFAPDEKGRNLRLLAYLLRVSTENEREQLILKDIGNSLDVSKAHAAPVMLNVWASITFSCSCFFFLLFCLLQRLDSFIELVASSIEYGESTSYELRPAKKQFLNVPQLRSILELSEDLRERQSLKAAGIQP
jgi:hypothetical protein